MLKAQPILKLLGCRLFLTPVLIAFFFARITCVSEEKAGSDPESTPRAGTKEPAADATVKGEFVIGSGDVLNIFVWKEPEVSKTVPVRPDGKISLPLLDDIQASGLTAMELKAELEQRLSKFFADPVVTITVETINSQKVTIMGEVAGAGSKPLTGPTRVLDIIANAGLTPFSKTTKIYILRNEDGKVVRFGFNYKDYIKGKNIEQNILLKSGDTIVVP